MISCSKSEVRRCRPLLGTFVEISATGASDTLVNEAVNRAFQTIERIQNLLSAHDENSELSRLNREAAERPIVVSPETFNVLRRADRLAGESEGAFDYTIAPILARWGLLPKTLARSKSGSWRHVLLLRGRKVYFLQPLKLDLGGIAKGFAVDAAVKILQKHKLDSGIVNAGGDLRVFGAQPSVIHLRHPAHPQLFSNNIQIQNAALATSSPYFSEKVWRGQRVSHLVDTLRQKAITGAVSVSVRAKECWLADALTKVVLNAPQLSERLLAKYEAEAFMVAA
jgi:thiamine biosynthesis lipoprotein